MRSSQDYPLISRRDVLKTAAVSMLAGSTGAFAQKAADETSGFIDAHSHIWTPDTDVYPLAGDLTVDDLKPRSFTPQELMAIAQPEGVRKVVLIQHNVFHGTDNSYMIDTIKQHPDTYSAVARVDASATDVGATMDRLRRQGVRGLRILPGDGGTEKWSDSPGMKQMWAHGADIGLALCPLINPGDISEVDTMCGLFPQTTVVVDHFARIGVDGTIHADDLKNLLALARHKHAHVKVSAYYALGRKQPPHDELIPMIEQLKDKFGAERLMWASDCPYQLGGTNTYRSSISLIRERMKSLTDRDRQWLLRDTAHKVFFS